MTRHDWLAVWQHARSTPEHVTRLCCLAVTALVLLTLIIAAVVIAL